MSAPPVLSPPSHHDPTTTTTEQTHILTALSTLLHLLHHQRWLPTTAAHNLTSLRQLQLQLQRRPPDIPPPDDTDTMMQRLQHTAQQQQQQAWERMTAPQRRSAYERLVRMVRDAARARERSAEGDVLSVFDGEFDEAVGALVERWGETEKGG